MTHEERALKVCEDLMIPTGNKTYLAAQFAEVEGKHAAFEKQAQDLWVKLWDEQKARITLLEATLKSFVDDNGKVCPGCDYDNIPLKGHLDGCLLAAALKEK